VKEEEAAAEVTNIDFNASKLRIIFGIVYWKVPCDQLQQHNSKTVHIAFSCQLGCPEVPAKQVHKSQGYITFNSKRTKFQSRKYFRKIRKK